MKVKKKWSGTCKGTWKTSPKSPIERNGAGEGKNLPIGFAVYFTALSMPHFLIAGKLSFEKEVLCLHWTANPVWGKEVKGNHMQWMLLQMTRATYLLESSVPKLPNVMKKLGALGAPFKELSHLLHAVSKQNKTQTQVHITQREARWMVSA